MGSMASQITSLTNVCSTIYLDIDQRKHQSSASLAFVWGIHRWPVISLHKGPVMWKMFPFHDVIMRNSLLEHNKANLRDLIAATGLVISNWIQIVNFSARVTVKFDGWPCKTIGHLFYATSSFVHLFVPIGEFKLKLQSGNAQSGSNWMIFRAVRPWNLTDDLAKQ